MKKSLSRVFLALFACAQALNVFAQVEPQEKRVVLTPGISPIGAFGIEAIKNAPFSGELLNECTQTLADGNRISQQTSSMIYRDGQGRIRREISVKTYDRINGGYRENKTIQVSDQFSGQNFTLNPQNHTAITSTARPMNIPTVPNNAPLGDKTGAPNAQTARILPVPIASLSMGSPDASCGSGLRMLSPQAGAVETKNESLGSQLVEGIAANGIRIIKTIPAGLIGNENPIEITYERWRSNELHIDVLIKSVDPRFGESTQRMTNINLGEPDASLFEIPQDYTVNSLGSRPATNQALSVSGASSVSSDNQTAVLPMTASLKPTILYREKAQYTEEARQNRIEGTVVLSVVFNMNGFITNIQVVRGLPDGLTEKAIEAAKKIKFKPAVNNGSPVSVRGSLQFSFTP